MVVGIGCDIVSHEIMEKLEWATNNRILARVFTPSEIECFEEHRNLKYLAGRFAVKESVLKCLGTGMEDGFALKDIEILSNDTGTPLVKLYNRVLEYSSDLGITNWTVSIFHTALLSTAVVTAQG